MSKIIPHFWYDKEAMGAAKLYTQLFDDSEILESTILENTPSGEVEVVEFKIAGSRFTAMSAGPYFKFNPSVSIMVSLRKEEDVDRLYTALAKEGSDLMPLGEYPFSKKYAWIEDRFGLTWQLMLDKEMQKNQRVTPSLLFADKSCGRAEEAAEYYLSVFPGSEKGHISYYSEGEAYDKRAKINFAELNLLGERIVFMDHGMGGDFSFNEAISFQILCEDQKEIDYYWKKLSFVPEAEQCGWVKDKFGVSWQIVPRNMNELMKRETEDESRKAVEAMLAMKKIDIEKLKNA